MKVLFLFVNAYVNVFPERSPRANEGHIGANESPMITMKETWTQMNVHPLQMNSKRCNKPGGFWRSFRHIKNVIVYVSYFIV